MLKGVLSVQCILLVESFMLLNMASMDYGGSTCVVCMFQVCCDMHSLIIGCEYVVRKSIAM